MKRFVSAPVPTGDRQMSRPVQPRRLRSGDAISRTTLPRRATTARRGGGTSSTNAAGTAQRTHAELKTAAVTPAETCCIIHATRAPPACVPTRFPCCLPSGGAPSMRLVHTEHGHQRQHRGPAGRDRRLGHDEDPCVDPQEGPRVDGDPHRECRGTRRSARSTRSTSSAGADPESRDRCPEELEDVRELKRTAPTAPSVVNHVEAAAPEDERERRWSRSPP